MHSTRWLEALRRRGVSPESTWIRLQGSSMEPAYAHGDDLLVEPLAGASWMRPGEVVVACHGDRLVSHRVVSLRDGMVILKGDACWRADAPVPVDAVLGRVVGFRPAPRLFPGARMVKRLFRQILNLPAEVFR